MLLNDFIGTSQPILSCSDEMYQKAVFRKQLRILHSLKKQSLLRLFFESSEKEVKLIWSKLGGKNSG